MNHNQPSIADAIALVRDHYGLTMQAAITLLKTPIHPKTLRDEIAIAAVTGLGSSASRWLAQSAYALADAMLAERIKNA